MLFLLMSALSMIGLVVLAIIIVFVIVVIASYNNLINRRNRVQDASAQIDVQLKRRYDLIPNLVQSVKGYMKYEKAVLTKVTQLRSSIVTGTMQDKANANNQISQALKTIFAVAENYPDLKASQNFKQLQDELTDTEDKISFVRTSYNDYVLDYNNAIQTWPGKVFADWFHFAKSDFFKAPAEAAEPVKVNFDDVNADSAAAANPIPQAAKSNSKQTAAGKGRANRKGKTNSK